MYKSIRPGQVWLDTEGKRIQAHGGSVMYLNGTYYWYGENKEKTDGKNGIWHWGVRCYSSRDLYNWEDRGIIIPPETDNPQSSLHPASHMDRPHIIYNEKTKKFVCWIKVMNQDGSQSETILTADSILGPYIKVKEGLMPLGMPAGDFDLAAAEDGKAYYYFEKVHSEMICADLTEDYTDVTGNYTSHFPRPYPPFVREGIAHFVRRGKHYILSSGTTGYKPNPSEVAVADDWHGPYRELGNPHPDDRSRTSYHSQISSVFKVHGRDDLYIACADRWIPEQTDIPYDAYEQAAIECSQKFQKLYSEKHTPEEFSEIASQIVSEANLGDDADINTSIADYVWLPLRFQEPCPEYPEGMVFIDWMDEWTIE